MTNAATRTRAARTPAPRTLAGAAVAMLLALALLLAGASLGHHAHLIDWGIALMAATVAGAAAGLPLAARR
jgi:hypothetical protein